MYIETITKDLEKLEMGSFKTPCHPCMRGTEYDVQHHSEVTTASTYPVPMPSDIIPIEPANVYIDGKSVFHSVEEFIAELFKPTLDYVPDRILKSGPATIVFWKDGTKTIVKLAADEPDNEYTAFCCALSKKVLGNNNTIKKIIKQKTKHQEK